MYILSVYPWMIGSYAHMIMERDYEKIHYCYILLQYFKMVKVAVFHNSITVNFLTLTFHVLPAQHF